MEIEKPTKYIGKSISMPDEDWSKLDKLCRQHQVSRSYLVRMLLKAYEIDLAEENQGDPK